MSIEEPPNPVLNTYEQWNWENPYVLYNERAMNQAYITYKTAQPYAITFMNNVNVLSHLIAGNYIANTVDVNEYWNYSFLESIGLSWVSQNYTKIKTDLINSISSVLNVGTSGILSLTGTLNLNLPLTPNYTTNIPFSLTDGTYTYGTAGKIGYTIVRANSGGYINGSPAGDLFYREISNISLTQGIWLLSAETQSSGINGSQSGIGFNTTTNTNAGGIGFRGLVLCEYPSPTDPPAQLSTSAVYYASGAVTMRLMMGCIGYGLSPGKSYLTAVRIA